MPDASAPEHLIRNDQARAFVDALLADGVGQHVENLSTQVDTHRWGAHLLPITISDGARSGTFLCSPRTGYIDYPLEELDRFPSQGTARLLRPLVRAMGGIIAPAQVDRVVHLNNWLFSTNLHPTLDIGLVGAETKALTTRFPTHLLAMRSLTMRQHAPLIDALRQAGWLMMPSRQVYITDDCATETLPRKDSRKDAKRWARMPFTAEVLDEPDPGDLDRIVALYTSLYVTKHSRLNPHYTPAFLDLAQRIGLLTLMVLRDGDGVIQGFGAMQAHGAEAAMPLIGYNTAWPRAAGLYRLVCHMGTLRAAELGLRYNRSSGVGAFKMNRGATPEMEFTAYYLRHLPVRRRLPFALLHQGAVRVARPVMERFAL